MNSRDLMLLAMARKGGGSGGGSTSWNDLKDKPFYEEVESVFYLDEATLDGFEKDNYNRCEKALWDTPLMLKQSLEEGKTYSVLWDGVEYKAELRQTEGGYHLGQDLYLYRWESTLPFGIWFTYEDRGAIANVISNSTEESSHTLTIYEVKKTVKPLDTKYLPEALQLGEGELTVVVPETTVTASMEGVPIGEPTDLIEVGTTCIVSYNGTDYECVAYDTEGDVSLGNGSLFGMEGGNNEPFIIAIIPAGIFLFAEGTTTISVKAKPIIKLDEKYLPPLKEEYSVPVFDLQRLMLEECNQSLNQYDKQNCENKKQEFPMAKRTWNKIVNMFELAYSLKAVIIIREYGIAINPTPDKENNAVSFGIRDMTIMNESANFSCAYVELTYNEVDGICTETIVEAQSGYLILTFP